MGIVLVAKSRESKVQPRLKLAPDWKPSRDPVTESIQPQGRLWDFIEKIASSRREGKNRRDGATVSTRVLKLTDDIGRRLFGDGQKGGMMTEEDLRMLSKSQKKREAMHARANL